MRNMQRTLTLLALGLVAASVQAQSDDYRGFFGVRVGASYFTNSDMRDYFGSGKIAIGFGPVAPVTAKDWKVGTDVDLQYANENGNRVLLIPLTLGISRTFGKSNNGGRPYMALRAGAAYLDYAITPVVGTRISEHKVVPAANAEVGLVFGDRMKLSARYDYFGRTRGFTFDAVQFSLSYGLVKF